MRLPPGSLCHRRRRYLASHGASPRAKRLCEEVVLRSLRLIKDSLELKAPLSPQRKRPQLGGKLRPGTTKPGLLLFVFAGLIVCVERYHVRLANRLGDWLVAMYRCQRTQRQLNLAKLVG